MTYYCTLADAKATMRADSTLDDALLLSLIGQVSARIDLLMSTNTPYFQPYTDALEFEVVAQRVDSGRNAFILPPGSPLLALTSVLLNGAAVTASAHPATRSPISMIRRTDGGSWYENGTDDPPTVVITGVWGYHRRYAQAWSVVDALAAAVISTTATTIMSLIHISKPTRLLSISYAVFCLKKKKTRPIRHISSTPKRT